MRRLPRRRPSLLLIAAAILLASSLALANGRFPRAERLRINPARPNELALAATYGILRSADRGRSWHHVCEASFAGSSTYTGDPLLDFLSDGAWLVGVQASLNVARDGACQFTPVLGGNSTYVVDYTIARGPEERVVALLATYEKSTVDFSLVESRDGARSFTPFGSRLPVGAAYTVDIDPVRPDRLYVSAITDNVGQLLRSDDRGVTWRSFPIASSDTNQPPYIAAIDPRDPERIYVRTDAWVPLDGDLAANDALLFSSDGGASWAEIFRNRAKLFAFALSPDGSEIMIGFGDPALGAGTSVSGALGVFRSRTDAFRFEHALHASAGCLTWTAEGVYVCGSQLADGFELAFFPGADLSLGTRCATVLRLGDVEGPLDCPTGTRGTTCSATWPGTCALFGACDGGTARPACGEVDSGSLDASRDVEPFDAAIAPRNPSPSPGCDCRAAPPGPSGVPGVVVAVLVAATRLRRRPIVPKLRRAIAVMSVVPRARGRSALFR
jgi:MYXO-CTERM domain-containing protein